MLLCNDTITVFNRRWDSTTGEDVYQPTTITGVSWYGEVVSNLGDRGLNAANRYTVRIPIDADFGGKTYVDPTQYDSATTVTGMFTLANGDRIIKGAAPSVTMTPAEIDAHYHYHMTILGVTDNRRAPNAPHFKVVGQ